MQKKLAFNIKTFESKLDGFQIYTRIEQGVDTILLDSSMPDSPYSHFSIIGVNPFLTIKYENKTIYEKWHDEEMKTFSTALHQIDVFSYLNTLMASYHIENTTDLPFIGGGLGYFSYDLGSEVESLPFHAPDLVTVPEVYFVFYDNAIVIDHHRGTVSITGLGILRDAQISVNYLENRILSDSQSDQIVTNLEMVHEIESQRLNQALEYDQPNFISPYTAESYQDSVEIGRAHV